jgi:tetratricopeptide (TPR) repeat protein
MRRIAIFAIGILAALPAFSQAPPAGAPGATGAAAAAAKGPHPKSREENDALLAMFKTPDPDAQIKASQDLLSKYPDTDYKSQALIVQAQAYHAKKDEPKAIVAAESALDADPKSYDTMLLLAEIYSRTTRATDLDMDDRIAKSDKFAKEALALLATAEKPKPDMADADWEGLKQGETQRAWVALGFTSLLRKKYDDAKANFEKGIALYPDPLDMLYIERAYMTAKRYDDAISWIDKVSASPNANDNLKKIATNDKAHIEVLKKQAQ